MKRAHQVHQVHQVHPEHLVPKEPLVVQDRQDHLELVEVQDHLVVLVHQVSEHLAPQEHLEPLVVQDRQDHLEPQVLEHLVVQDRQDHLEPQV